MNNRVFQTPIPKVIALCYLGILLVRALTNPDTYQWDFKTYYFAAKAQSAGLDPYDINTLSFVAQTTVDLEFVYPPSALLIFYPFSMFKFETAFAMFFAFKLVLLVGLTYLWKMEFLEREVDPLFYLYAVLAFNGSVLADIAVGNISIWEQCLLWLAFYFYLKRRLLLFGTLILIAASFKVTPILFLFLLWFSESEKRRIYFFGYIFLFLVLFSVLFLTVPTLFSGFVDNASELDERGVNNPSTLAFVRDGFETLTAKSGAVVSQIVPFGISGMIGVIVALLSWRSYITLKHTRMEPEDKMKIATFFACLVYALLLPRFKNYSYILLIVPSYFIIRKGARAYLYLLILTILPANMILAVIPTRFHSAPLVFFGEYYPLFVAYIVWILYLLLIRGSGKTLTLATTKT